MANGPTLAELREEIETLERVRDTIGLTPAATRRLRLARDRFSQEKIRLPLRIKATREKLDRLLENYYG